MGAREELWLRKLIVGLSGKPPKAYHHLLWQSKLYQALCESCIPWLVQAYRDSLSLCERHGWKEKNLVGVY